jgi:hypothetical protein
VFLSPALCALNGGLPRQAVVERGARTIAIICGLLLLIANSVGCSDLSKSATLSRMHELEGQLPVGLSRYDAYARLRARGLEAVNVNYTHWRLAKTLTGHVAAIPLDHGAWPTAGETYPPSAVELDLHVSEHRMSPPNPSVEVLVGGGYLFGCGLVAALGIAFDSHDAISKTIEIVNRHPCLGLG